MSRPELSQILDATLAAGKHEIAIGIILGLAYTMTEEQIRELKGNIGRNLITIGMQQAKANNELLNELLSPLGLDMDFLKEIVNAQSH